MRITAELSLYPLDAGFVGPITEFIHDLRGEPGLEVVGESGTAEEGIAMAERTRPDVVVMDLSMPGMGGLEAIRRLLAQDPKARVLALSAHEDTAHPRRVLRAGAMGAARPRR